MKSILTRQEKFTMRDKQLSKLPAKQKSLNSNVRKRELERITKENFKFLQRLQTKTSNYDKNKWKEDRKKQEHMMKRISSYPNKGINRPNSKNRRSLPRNSFKQKTKTRNLNSLPSIQEGRQEVRSYDVGFVEDSARKKKKYQSNRGSPGSNRSNSKSSKLIPMQVTCPDCVVDPRRRIIYRKVHKYGKIDYLIEIGKTKTKYFIVSIELNKKQRTEAIELHAKQGKKLIKNCGGVDSFADNIYFKFGKIMIQNFQDLLNQSIKPLDIHKYRDNRQVTIKNSAILEKKNSEKLEPLMHESEGSLQYAEQTEAYGSVQE